MLLVPPSDTDSDPPATKMPSDRPRKFRPRSTQKTWSCTIFELPRRPPSAPNLLSGPSRCRSRCVRRAPISRPDRHRIPSPRRKRTGYWWEELFGDDFLRTMDDSTDPK